MIEFYTDLSPLSSHPTNFDKLPDWIQTECSPFPSLFENELYKYISKIKIDQPLNIETAQKLKALASKHENSLENFKRQSNREDVLICKTLFFVYSESANHVLKSL